MKGRVPGPVSPCLRLFAALALALAARCAPALTVVWDNRTPQKFREWADRNYIREQMEVLGSRICTALYKGEPRERLHEDFTIILYLSPTKGGNPAFASGRRITWKVGENPRGDGSGGMGILCHEMTHVLDMASDGVFTEGMADWVRNYKVWYVRCTNPGRTMDFRYKALRGGRSYGKYQRGAHFVEYMTLNYGEGTIYRILQGYKQNGKNHWERTFGKDFAALLREWKSFETIHDPVFQWTYDGTTSGKVRRDGGYNPLKSLSATPAHDKSGAWLNGSSGCVLSRVSGGNISIAFHGWFGGGRNRLAIASIGSAAKNGKAVLLATTGKPDELEAHVVATVPGFSQRIVSTKKIAVPGLASKPHSVVIAVKGGEAAAVVVDGATSGKIDMSTKCQGCTFTPAAAFGGMCGGIGVNGISEPRGEAGIRLDDARIFNRTFRARETKTYAATFNAEYRPAVAVEAMWTGKAGDASFSNPRNWYCVNSIGEKIWALPTRDTVVNVLGRNIPSIPKGSRFACKSFNIAGLAIVDSCNIDLRGVPVVDVEDNSRIITRNKHALAVSCLRAKRIRLDGALMVERAMKVSEKLSATPGSILSLPPDPDKALAGALSVGAGEGVLWLRPGAPNERGRTFNVMRLGAAPEDMSRLGLLGTESLQDAVFKMSADGSRLTGYRRK